MIRRLPRSPLFHYTSLFFFFFNDTATTEIYTLSLHDALPITSSIEIRPSERERSSRTSSAWGKILVVPSPTVSHSPSTSAWGTADPPESHDTLPPAWPGGRGPSVWGSANHSISVLNPADPGY